MEYGKVSVIIPVYNGEKSIARCLDSVRCQTYQDLEILVINDGSTDNSLSICESLAEQDTRIRVISQKNAGVSAARNAGLQSATGIYLQFVDADDYVDSEITEYLVTYMEKEKSELAVCSYFDVIDCYDISRNENSDEGCLSVDAYMNKLLQQPSHFYFGVLWNKLYRRSLVETNHLQFDKNISFGEDFIFNMEYLSYVKQVAMCREPLYFYAQETGNSLTRSKQSCEVRMRQREVLYEALRNYFVKNGTYESVKESVDRYLIDHSAFEFDMIIYKEKKKGATRRQELQTVQRTLKKYHLWSRKKRLWLYFTSWKSNTMPFLSFRNLKQMCREGRVKTEALYLLMNGYRRVLYPLVKGRKKKRVLLLCSSTTMEYHILKYYDQVKYMENVSFYLWYSGADSEYVKALLGERNITQVTKKQAFRGAWHLVVSAETDLPRGLQKHQQPMLYVNHGLHINSFDRGVNLYAYTKWWSLNIDGTSRFTKMLESNKRYCELVKRYNPLLEDVIVYTGWKDWDEIQEAKDKKAEYRRQLGIPEETTVVSVFGTWHTESLFHRVGKALVQEAETLLHKKYYFVLSIHPKEYTIYDEAVEPLGHWVDSLSDKGFRIRSPGEDYIPFLMASDVVISDYSSMYEVALMAEKPLILSEFHEKKIWRESIAAELKNQIPVYRQGKSLEDLIESAKSEEMLQICRKYGQELGSKQGLYREKVVETTEELLWAEQEK